MERLSLKDIKDPRDKIITDLELKINSLKEQLEKEREEINLLEKYLNNIVSVNTAYFSAELRMEHDAYFDVYTRILAMRIDADEIWNSKESRTQNQE